MYRVLDVNTYLGHWPFRSLPAGDAAGLLSHMGGSGISASIVTPMSSVFYKDCLAGFREMISQISSSDRLFPLAVVNPAFPGWEEDLASMVDMGAVGVRLFPNYHGYRPFHGEATRLIRIASEMSLPTVITFRIQDERSHHWLVKVPPLSVMDVKRAISAVEGARFILTNVTWAEVEALADIMDSSQTFVEISSLKGPIFAVERLLERLRADRIIYGSAFPMQYFECTLLRVTMAQVSDELKRKILYENAFRAFGRLKAR